MELVHKDIPKPGVNELVCADFLDINGGSTSAIIDQVYATAYLTLGRNDNGSSTPLVPATLTTLLVHFWKIAVSLPLAKKLADGDMILGLEQLGT